MSKIVDLDGYRSPGSQVFAGRERGKKVREAARLDELDLSDDEITVVVPDDIYSINSSFFLGMFGPSVRSLGEARFRKKYRFSGADLDALIEEGIREALLTTSPI